MDGGTRSIKSFAWAGTTVLVQEELGDSQDEEACFGLGWYVWPSAIALAAFLAHHMHLVAHKRVLEMGAGTALPGLLAAKFGAAHVTLTDKSDAELVNARDAIRLNGLDLRSFTLMPLMWGEDHVAAVDIVLAADCFYNPDDFEDTLATMALILRRNPHCVVYTTYQLRRSSIIVSIHHSTCAV
ncbi:Aste57867_14019 [Aphanomyces stellatus]|uniref:Aste57867_14019 protein n=1 Tax=Aphanomyces stellatus TaxID=120398 RepID=A0A485KZY1_9STRA|nr:hypothetical protein As57867_013968 [Aphanomyces stellatus]VFT90849.1 Aste57867_14019 [Aphanomyces stellatus]